MMKKFFLPLLILFIPVFAFAQTGPLNNSVFQTLAKNGNTSLFAEALRKSGLDILLQSGTYTLFVPRDDAFRMLPDSLLNDTAFVTELVKNSIVTGNYNKPALTASVTAIATKTIQLKTLSGNDLTLHLNTDHNLEVCENKGPVALVTAFDLPFSGGTVHLVNNLFYPIE